MEQQNHNQLPPLQKGTNKKQRLMTLLLVFLLLLALFSSVLVGFLIGRNTDPYRGQIIDTIFIGPDRNRTVHVSGQVVYSDGTPYADGTVELRSEPIITTTDYKGRFFMNRRLREHILCLSWMRMGKQLQNVNLLSAGALKIRL